MTQSDPQTTATLHWVTKEGNCQCTLTGPSTTIGRKSDCDLVLAHTTISRVHARIDYREGGWFLVDMDSSYGTRLEGKTIAPETPVALRHGDTLHIGKQKMVFQIGPNRAEVGLHALELNFSTEDLDAEHEKVRAAQHALVEQALDGQRAGELKAALDQELASLADFAGARFKEYEVLQEITQIIVGILDLRELLSTVLKLASRVLNADRGFILLYDASHNDLRSMVTRHFDREDQTALEHDYNFSQTISRSCFETREPVIINDAMYHERFAGAHSIMASSIRSVVCLPLIKGDQVSGVLYLDNLTTPGCFNTHQLSFLKAFAAQTALALDNARLYTQAVTDGLTGLYNRKFADERITEEMVRSRRYQRSCSLILMDVDHFKQVNDTLGHHAGDVVLQRIAACMQEQARSSDIVARYGGEEFLMLLTETDDAGARIFAERLRAAVEALHIEVDGQVVPVTASCGVATYRAEFRSSVQAFVSEADQGLYRAKQTGRNRVCHMLD